MVGARVNGKLVNIDYILQNGDRVEVMTSQNSKGPSRDWLKIVKSSQAKNKINAWYKQEHKEDNIARGRDLVDKYCKAKGINFADINKPEFVDKVLKRYAYNDWDALLASVGHGALKEGQIINRMIEERDKKLKREMTDAKILETINENKRAGAVPMQPKSKSGIVVKGIHDLAVRFSKCCSPVPGDEICGFVTRGRGVTIHRTDCVNVLNLPEIERARLIEAEWQPGDGEQKEAMYYAELSIYGTNRVGLFVDVSRIFTERQIDLKTMNARTNKQGDKATVIVSFNTRGVEELNYLMSKLRQIEGVYDIERTTG